MITIDLETTGFGYNKGDKIISFGYTNDSMSDFGEIFCDVPFKISPHATRVHGITNSRLKELSNGKTFIDNAREIYKILDGEIVLEYSKSDFDSSFLREEFKNAGMSMPKCEFINVYKLVNKQGSKRLKDSYLYALKHTGNQPIQFDQRFEEITGKRADSHGALYDAFMCMVCYAYFGNKGKN